MVCVDESGFTMLIGFFLQQPGNLDGSYKKQRKTHDSGTQEDTPNHANGRSISEQIRARRWGEKSFDKVG